jgi:hypothetical protein
VLVLFVFAVVPQIDNGEVTVIGLQWFKSTQQLGSETQSKDDLQPVLVLVFVLLFVFVFVVVLHDCVTVLFEPLQKFASLHV